MESLTNVAIVSSAVLVVVLISLALFLLIRSVLLWYWKVDQQIALLTEIRDSLRTPAKRSPSTPDAVDAVLRR